MPIYMDILNYMFVDDSSPFKILLMGHFTLTAFGAIGSFIPNLYLFYNVPVIPLLLWRLQEKKTLEPLRLIMATELCSMLIDFVYIGYHVGGLNYLNRTFITIFSLVFALGHMMVKPFVVLHILKINDTIESLSGDTDEDNDEEAVDEVYVDKNPFEPPRKR